MKPIHRIAYLDTLARLAGLWSGNLYPWDVWAPARHEVQRVAGLLGYGNHYATENRPTIAIG